MPSTDCAITRCRSVCLPVCLSACLSVCHMLLVFSWNGYTYPQTFFTVGNNTILAFANQMVWQYSDGDTPNGRRMQGGMNKLRFSTNISFCLGSNTKQSYSYYGRQIGNHTRAFKWCHFLWSWPRFHGHGIIQRQITWKWYMIELYLQWQTNNMSYMVYQMAPFLVTLNDL